MPPLEHTQPAKLLAHAVGLRRLALALTREAEFADDVVQQTMIAALERRPDADLPLGPWLARVARHWIAKTRRTRERRVGIETRAARAEALPATQDLVIRAEMHRELVAVVLALEERQRDAILLRYLECLTPPEIAARLDVPLRTVNTRLARGLVRLREELDRRGGRERWLHAFLLLPRAPHGPFALGVLAMKSKLLVAAIVIAILCVGVYMRLPHEALTLGASSGGASASIETPETGVDADSSSVRTAVVEPARPEAAPSIDPERDLCVVVVRTDGAPIPDAALTVVRPLARQLPGLLEKGSELDQLIAQARTDAKGQCAFHLEPRRLYDLTASAPGFARVARRSLYAGEQLRIVLPRGATLVGSVNSAIDGAPIPGARVVAQLGVLAPLGDDGFRTRTDANGHFELADLPVDLVDVHVTAHDFMRLDKAVGVLSEGERRELKLVLNPGGVVRGQVTDGATKLPIAGATVELRDANEENHATTDADGRYSLRGSSPGDRAEITARAPGYGDFSVIAPGVAQGEIVQDIFLLPGRRARGRVVDTHGAPIANANIVASTDSWANYVYQSEKRRTQTDTTGRFELAGLRVDLRHTLLVHAAGFATAVRDFPEREWETMELELGDLVLAPPATIAGHVRSPAGNAVVGRWVLLYGEPRERDAWAPAMTDAVGYSDSEGFGFGRVMARTDERGRYSFSELPGGRYRVWAGDKGFPRGAEITLDLEDGEQVLDLDLELDEEPSIRGVVVDQDGRPLDSIAVDMYTTDSPPTRASYALTAIDGTFALCGLEPGNYDLRFGAFFRTDDKSSRLAQISLHGIPAGTRDVRIAMPRALETTVHVVGPDGKPVFGACVLISSDIYDDGWESLGPTDAEGRFVLWLAESTTTKLRVTPPFGPKLGGYDPVIDADGKFDGSYEVFVAELRAGSSDCVVRFARLP